MNDEFYMAMAIDLAKIGSGRTSPNPLVGAVLVQDHRVVGFGAHLEAGKPHAEIHALRMAGDQAKDSTLYVTLEPCSHYGKTPPCADAVIAAGVRRVVIAVSDPFAQVSGGGILRLRQAGLEVVVGCLEKQAIELNSVFFHYAKTGLPFVVYKTATTLDGFIATTTGDSMYITGPEAREAVHRLRDHVDVIAVGINTVLADDPQLTVRLEHGGRNPVRVIFDSQLRTPLSAKVVQDREAKTIIMCGENADKAREAVLREASVEVVRVQNAASADGSVHLSIPDALAVLANRGLIHVLLEGGQRLASAFLDAKLVQKVWFFHAPKLLGAGLTPLVPMGITALADAVVLSDTEVTVLGQDVLVKGTPVYRDKGR